MMCARKELLLGLNREIQDLIYLHNPYISELALDNSILGKREEIYSPTQQTKKFSNKRDTTVSIRKRKPQIRMRRSFQSSLRFTLSGSTRGNVAKSNSHFTSLSFFVSYIKYYLSFFNGFFGLLSVMADTKSLPGLPGQLPILQLHPDTSARSISGIMQCLFLARLSG